MPGMASERAWSGDQISNGAAPVVGKRGRMGTTRLALRTATLIAMLAGVALATDNRKEFKYNVASDGNVTINNALGPVTVKSGPGRQVLIVATTHSDKVEVDGAQAGNRVESRSHTTQKASGDEARVDYDVTVPADVDVTIHGGSGQITVGKMRSDVLIESESGKVDVGESANGHIHVRSVTGPINVWSINNGHIEITTVSGDVTLKAVNGPHLNVNAGKGNITYDGDFAGSGTYLMMNNSGNIDVTVPGNASISLKARTINGTVENDLPLQTGGLHVNFGSAALDPKRSLVGTSNSGSASVELRSFSGKIRVKKQ